MKETLDKYDVTVLVEYLKSMSESYKSFNERYGLDSHYNEGRQDAYDDAAKMVEYLLKGKRR